MADEKLDPTKFEISAIGPNQNDIEFLMIQVPVKHLAKRGEDGLDEAQGKCRRIEAVVTMHVRNAIKLNLENKARLGVITPSKPMTVQ